MQKYDNPKWLFGEQVKWIGPFLSLFAALAFLRRGHQVDLVLFHPSAVACAAAKKLRRWAWDAGGAATGLMALVSLTCTKAEQMQGQEDTSSAISLLPADQNKKVSTISQLLPHIRLDGGAHLGFHLQFGKLGGKMLHLYLHDHSERKTFALSLNSCTS